MAILKADTTIGGATVLTDGIHNNTGDPHDQYKLKSELTAEYYTSATVDTLLAQNSIDDQAASAGFAAAAAVSATNAATSETNAATSATQAATSATNANTSASEAAASEANAATSETNAAASAAAASTSETNAATSETNASTSATNAATSETNAATSETNAGTSETNAAASETAAVNAQSYAEEWANKAEDSLVSVAAGGDNVDDYSALHWANKAAASAASVPGTSDDTTWTGSQRGAVTVDNDLSFDMDVGNNFKATPTATGTLTFTNIAAGQSGFVWLDNSGAHVISAAATTFINSADLSTISTAGVYVLGYESDGTNVAVTVSQSLTSGGV